MHSTSASLLIRLKQPKNELAWQRFVDLYTPMIYRWAIGIGLPSAEASDLVQEVLLTASQKLPSFEYDSSRSFRSWLKTVTLNRTRDFLKRLASQRANANFPLDHIMSAQDEAVTFLSTQEYNTMLTERALKFIQTEFEESTWRACWMFVVDGKSASEVSHELGVSENSVYLSKSRVMRRLRVELEGLLE